jgi:hypothetical protein
MWCMLVFFGTGGHALQCENHLLMNDMVVLKCLYFHDIPPFELFEFCNFPCFLLYHLKACKENSKQFIIISQLI